MELNHTMEKLAQVLNLPQSPCYIFDSTALKHKIQYIHRQLSHCNKLCFAMKANPFLVQMVNEEIDRFEVCSPGEYEICRNRGIRPEKIIVSGVNKTEQSMRRILTLSGGKGIYTIESPLHYQILSKLCEEMNLSINVMIRLSSGNQFGVDKDTFASILMQLQADDHCNFRGIHFFSGTQKKLKKMEKELARLNDYAKELKERFSLKNLELEYGPGLAVSYFDGEKIPSAQEQLEQLDGFLAQMDQFDAIGVEAGRFIAADCGHFLTQVMDLKKTDGSNYVILDSGIHQLHYFGQMMGMKIPPMIQIPARSNEENQEYVLCGSLCTVNDVLVRDAVLSGLQIGDHLLFGCCGAYSMTEGSALFLSRELPAVYEYTEDGSFRCLRSITETYPLNTK